MMARCSSMWFVFLFAALSLVTGKVRGEDPKGQKPHHWNYHGMTDGVDSWHSSFPVCAEERQSPIDIKRGSTIYEETLNGISLSSTGPLSLGLLNNGHTVVGAVKEDVYVSGGRLDSDGTVFKTHSFHFHWGRVGEEGSEHTVDRQAFPLEMHIVHYDSSKYASLKEAASEERGLAVLGVLFEESVEDNNALNPIIDALSAVQQPLGKENILDVANVDLNALLPTNTENYYRYSGSLTTPPCFQSVVWTVFSQVNHISGKQLEELRRLVAHIDDDGSSQIMVDNWRPTQPLNGRQVFRSFEFAVGEELVQEEDITSGSEDEELVEEKGDVLVPGKEEQVKVKPEKAHWSYVDHHGPSHWSESYPHCASSNPRQSPVDIIEDESVDDDTGELTDIDFIQEGSGDSISYFNNGHTVVGLLHRDVVLVGGGLDRAFKLHSFHFHWGGVSDIGSEHTVNGKAFPLELHMVHYDQERAKGLKEAIVMDNGLAVLGTLFEISAENNTAYDAIIVALRQIQEASNAVESWHSSPHVDLRSLLPVVTEDYFRYEGSLTTPPCTESVVWTVFRNRQRISEAQMEEFRRLLEFPDEEGTVRTMKDNYRPVQPLHKRVIKRSFQKAPKVVKPRVQHEEESPSVHESKMLEESNTGMPSATTSGLLLLVLLTTACFTHF